MFDFSTLPVSPEECRAARGYFCWSQAKAAEESGLPLHKIKRFESGNYIPDIEFLDALRAFFENRGCQFAHSQVPGDSAKRNGHVFPGGVVGDIDNRDGDSTDYRGRTAAAKVHHMRIALKDEGEMGRALDLIEENEERVAELLRNPIKTGLFDLADETKAHHAEAVRLLAENGMLFARLFGRDFGGKPSAESLKSSKDKPTTTRDLLHRMQADAHLVAAGDLEAKDRRKARKPATSVSQALGLS